MSVKPRTRALTLASVLAAVLSSASPHTEANGKSVSMYTFGSALLKDERGYVFTPVYRIQVDADRISSEQRSAKLSLEARVRNHITGVMGKAVLPLTLILVIRDPSATNEERRYMPKGGVPVTRFTKPIALISSMTSTLSDAYAISAQGWRCLHGVG